jgi:hypothetical protein
MMSLLHKKAGRLAALTAVALLGSAPAWAQTVDGTRDASYPAALAVQAVTTGFGNSNTGQVGVANGDELDNIHAQIVGSNLYLFIGGNLQTNNNRLEIFFDSQSGGQNVLATGGGGPLASLGGLTFDAGFAADYLLSVGANQNGANFNFVYVDYGVVGSPGSSGSAGGGSTAGVSQSVDFDVSAGTLAGEVGLNNSNTAGVSDVAVGNPGAVNTGVELRIPLSAIGAGVNSGDIRVCVFTNGSNHDYVSNQVLAPLPSGSGNLGGNGSGGYVGGGTPVAGVNFASFAGNQYVTIANGGTATQPAITVSPTSLNFNNVPVVGGAPTRTFTITNGGGGITPLNVTITPPSAAYTVSSGMVSLPAGTSTTITVTFDPSSAGVQSGNITLTSNAATNPNPTVAVTGKGIAAGQVVLDGSVDASLYGTAKALQTTPTQFGDNNGMSGGSELDGAYARVDGTDLYVTLTGNLENGGNKVVLFIDANPNTGQPTFLGTNPSVDFGNSSNLAGLTFDRGFRPESFLSLSHNSGSLFVNYALMNGAGGNGTYLSAGSNAFTQPLDFGGGVLGEISFDNSNTAGVTGAALGNPGAVNTGIEIRIPLSVLGGTVTGTTPVHVMALVVNGNYDYLSNQTLGGLPNGTGNLGVNGSGGGSLPYTVDFLNYLGNQFFTAQRGDLTIAGPRDLAGDFNNITITPAGLAQVYSPLNVSGTLSDQGNLIFQPRADAIVSGSGSTIITGGLGISSAAGISASGATGNVQTTGRSFGTGAQYAYLNVVNGVTGSGLPGTISGLAVAANGNVTLSQGVSVSQGLALNATGNLITGGQPLTLLSSVAGTALVVNSGTGTVVGNATVQRAITNTTVTGPAYRHFSSPVTSTTFADLTTAGFTPDVSQGAAYNAAANPGTVTPFPTVYGYDQARLVTSPATSFASSFDKGWFAPTSLGQTMQVNRGYTVNAPVTATPIDFVGTLNNGAQNSGTLSRGIDANAGWQFLGNPYPAPLDWSTVGAGQRPGMDAAMYVFQSTSQYGGTYRTYANGIGVSPLIDAGSGYFTRVTTPGGTGSVNLTNANRVTSFGAQPAFGRGIADTRPMLQLMLRGAGLSDDAHVYFEAGATAATDVAYDAVKLPNTNGLNLASLAGNEALAINGLPAMAAATVVPLQVAVPAAGTYTLQAAALRNLPGTVYLLDATTGRRVSLSQSASYSFTATAASLAGRFALVFEPAAAPLASSSALEAAQVSVFPNPAQQRFTVLVPAATKAAPVTVTMFNSLGQAVRRTAQTSDATALVVDAAGLAAGVYTLRVQAGAAAPVTKRVVLE